MHTVKLEIASIDNAVTSKQDDIDSLLKEISDNSKISCELEAQVKLLQWERRKEEVSIHTKIKRLLESHAVDIHVYHGGQLKKNG